MKSLDYYLSIQADPWREDNSLDSEQILDRANFQYMFDSIIETIGTKECSYNINLFYNELMLLCDDTQKSNFYRECLQKLINVYELDYLEEDQEDPFPNKFNIDVDFKKVLEFFEQGKYVDYVVKYLPLENPIIIYKGSVKEHLSLHLNIFIKKLFSDEKETLPYLLKKYFYYASKNDLINTLIKLINKDKNIIVTNYYLKLKGLL